MIIVLTKNQIKGLQLIKKLIWSYFILLIFEGALRKWILPGLATPLLIIRDPIAIAIIYVSFLKNLWKPNLFVWTAWIVTLIGFITALIFGHGFISVALYGARITFFHFPVIFIMGTCLSKEDLLKMGNVILWITIGMTILVAIQFYSPQSAWVNRGVGGDLEGSGFSGAEGFFRVPGTFSFTNGLSNFYNLATCFIFYFLLAPSQIKINKYLLLFATISLLAAVPLSISRTVFFQIILTLIFIIISSINNRKLILRFIAGGFLTILLLFVLSNFLFFQTATSAFTTRFENASNNEGGVEGTLVDRIILGGMVQAVSNGSDNFFGKGLGLGSQAGAKLATGENGFLISEGEWGRLIGEQGLLFGLILILLRVFLGLNLLLASWKETKRKNLFPFIMVSYGIVMIINGQWAQPTALGFSTLMGGLVLAGINNFNIPNLKKSI